MARKVNAQNSERNTAKKKPRGRPFEKGNPHAWKKGECPNPGGRPKTKLVSEASRNWLARLSDGDSTITNAEALVEKIGEQALNGDLSAARELADRAEGRARQMVDVSIDERKREMAERAITALMADAGIERDVAIAELERLTPEIRQWIN